MVARILQHRSGRNLRMSEERAKNRWPGWAPHVSVALLGVLFVCLAVNQIADFDFWWLLSTGRYVAERGIPRADVFSFASEGRPWVELRWLFCLGLYGAVSLLGYTGANAIKVGLLALLAWISAKTPTRLPLVGGIALGSLSLLAISPRMILRPELASYLLFALFLFLLVRSRRSSPKTLLWLPLLQVVWVNAHTIFVMGPLLVGAFLAAGLWEWAKNRDDESVKERLRYGTFALIGCLLAALVNPYGAGSYAFAWQIFGEMRHSLYANSIAELRGPFELGLGFVSIRAFLALVVVVALLTLATLRRTDLFLLLVALAMGYVSFSSVRNIPFFVLAAFPLGIHGIQQIATGSRLYDLLHWLRYPVAGAAVLVSLYYSWAFATNREQVKEGLPNLFGLGLAEHHFAEGAAQYLDQAGLEGKIFATMDVSPILIFHRRQTLFDPRLEVHGEELYKRYIQIEDEPAKFQLGEQTYGYTIAVCNLRSPTVRTLFQVPNWHLVYFDEAAAVFVNTAVHSNVQPMDRQAVAQRVAEIREEMQSPRPWEGLGFFQQAESPLPYLAVAMFLNAAGLPNEALPFAQDAVAAKPFDAGLRAVYAGLLGQTDQREAAREEYEEALRLDPQNFFALQGLGRLLLQGGEAERAEEMFRKAIAVAPDDASAWFDLAGALMQQQDLPGASEALLKATELDPNNADYRYALGVVYAGREMFSLAYEQLQQALELKPDDFNILVTLGEVAFRIGDRDLARSWLERAERLDPDNPRLNPLKRAVGG